MDNATHTLFALTLARTPLGRAGRGTTAALVLASNAPDVDIVATLGGAANYLAWHRGPTHGPLGVIGLGLLSAGLAWTTTRLWGQRVDGGEPPARFSALVAVSMLGVLLHILMDLPTSYGTRLFSPFSWRWFAMDLMPIIDVYLWAVLGAGLAIGAWRPAARGKIAVIALALMAGDYGIRAVAHQRALENAARLYGSALPVPCDSSAAFGSLLDSWPQPALRRADASRCLIDTAAIPSFASPFDWRVIAQLPDEYVEIERQDVQRISNGWTSEVSAAASARSAQILLGFSRFPVTSVLTRESGGAVVQFSDLRFAEAPAIRRLQTRRSSLFTVTVELDADHRIVGEQLGQ